MIREPSASVELRSAAVAVAQGDRKFLATIMVTKSGRRTRTNTVIGALPSSGRLPVKNTAPSIHGAIDHIFLLVPDLDAAHSAFVSLGFTLSPRGRHQALNTANHVAVLERDYIELVSIERPGPENAKLRERVPEGGALLGVALPTTEVRSAVSRASAAGLSPADPQSFERIVEVEGQTKRARFETAHLSFDEAFGGYLFLCQHCTPELVWRPDQPPHNNGATSVACARIPTSPGERAGSRLGKVLGVDAKFDGGAWTLTKGGQTLVLAPNSNPQATVHVATPPSPSRLHAAGFSIIAANDASIATRHPAFGNIVIELTGRAGLRPRRWRMTQHRHVRK
jgi:hypothetical protein